MPRLTEEQRGEIVKEAKKERIAEKNSAVKPVAAPKEVGSNVSPVSVVGSLKETKVVRDREIDGMFKKIYAPRIGWIKMSDEDVAKYQAQGILIGHDPIDGMGLLKKD